MGTLSDAIEEYLKARLNRAGQRMIEVRRCDLAARFECVPSQINYVLETRFTPDRGYVVESRRGGGGFIRIAWVDLREHHPVEVRVFSHIGPRISDAEACDLLAALQDRGLLSDRHAIAIRVALARELDGLAPPLADLVRARLLKAMLRLCLEEVQES